MKLTKSQIRDIIMEELKNLENENNQIEEAGRARRFLTGLGLAAATALGTPDDAQAEKPSAASQISSFDKKGPKLPDLGDRYDDDYVGELEDKKTGERFLFKKEQNERGKTIIKLYKFLGGDKVDLDQKPIIMSAKDAEAKYDLKPGWLRRTSRSQITPNQAFNLKENNMKITKSYLKQVIAEELEKNLEEAGFLGGLKDKFAGTKLGQKMGMQTDKQKQDATKAAQDKKYRDYQETQAKTMATKNIVKNMVEEFPKKATYIHIHNPGGNSRQYAVDITYDVGSKRDQTTRKVFNEMEPSQLSSLLYNLGIYPDEATKVNDKDLGFNRGQFNVEVDRIKGTFDSEYKEWYQKFFGGQYKDFPEALQQGAQQLGLRNLQENNIKITKNYLKQVIMEELGNLSEQENSGYYDMTVHVAVDAKNYNGGDVKIKRGSYKIAVNKINGGQTIAVYTMPVTDGYAAGNYVADLTREQLKRENDLENVYIGVEAQTALLNRK